MIAVTLVTLVPRCLETDLSSRSNENSLSKMCQSTAMSSGTSRGKPTASCMPVRSMYTG